MNFTTFDGSKVAYRKDGMGPGLVLVHGTGGDSQSNWEEVSKKLCKTYTVVRPEYAGSGKTADDGRKLTVDYLADQVLAAVDHAGLERFALAGFSLGAAVAARIAANHPGRVSDLILTSGFAKLDSRLKLQFELWRDLIAADRVAMAKLILLTGFSPDALSAWGDEGVDQAVEEIVKTQNWQGMARQVDLDLALDISDVETKIVARTLVIGATHDHMVPPAHSRALAASIKNASFVELPSGHLSPMERPDLVASEIRKYLAEH